MSPENGPNLIYDPTAEKTEPISLTLEQKDDLRRITLGVEEVDETVRQMAVEDVINTLESGHPLNRIINNQEGEAIGYIACEDFVPHEAYIKYLATTGETGRNLFKEIPAFFEYAKQQGYTKLNFHGWNEDLNRVLEHFGFKRLRTDTNGEFNVDFYEKELVEHRAPEAVNKERAKAFEQKYINKINQNYEQTLMTFSEENRSSKEGSILNVFRALSSRLESTENFEFGDLQKSVLKLKLARHFQNNDTIDENNIYDAIIETPKFLSSDKGSLFRLLEIHEQKTTQKIAEKRKNRAEITGDETYNPYEALFETESGNYYVARLLNMPHLEQESDYMNHCVGTSDSYINRIKKGEIEILSFRQKSRFNPATQKLEGDRPIITIEYNLKTNTIEQMKKANGDYLSPEDHFFNDVIDALKKLRESTTDLEKPRDFIKISTNELQNISVSDYCVLTENGEVSFRDFDPDSGVFVLKMGVMKITSETALNDAVKILRVVEGINTDESRIARNQGELNDESKVYIGPIFAGFFQRFPNLEHIYISFPEGKINRGEFVTFGKTGPELTTEIKSRKINLYGNSEFMLQSPEFVVAEPGEKIPTVRLQVRALFSDENNHAYSEILARANELGLDFLPHETAADLLLNEETQPKMGEWYRVVSSPITDQSGSPYVFGLGRGGAGLGLYGYWAKPDSEWGPGSGLMFRLPQVSSES